MKYFYSAAVMGYGDGRKWHGKYKFPKFPVVTKTLTMFPKVGRPWAVLPIGKSVFNSVALSNIGLLRWVDKYKNCAENVTVSVWAENYEEMENMFFILDHIEKLKGIEINLSCPNVKNMYDNLVFPSTRHDLYLKLNHTMDPYRYDLSKIKGIRLNSIPLGFCGGSGKIAQEKNWLFIKKYPELPIAGCSFINMDDIKRLEDMGCKEIGIGSTILTNPRLIENLKEES